MATRIFSVPDMHCEHCHNAIIAEVSSLDGVSTVDVDADAKTVSVTGGALDEITSAIDEAGYGSTLL